MKKTLDVLLRLLGFAGGGFLIYFALREEPGKVVWTWLILGVFFIIIDICSLWMDLRKRNI